MSSSEYFPDRSSRSINLSEEIGLDGRREGFPTVYTLFFQVFLLFWATANVADVVVPATLQSIHKMDKPGRNQEPGEMVED